LYVLGRPGTVFKTTWTVLPAKCPMTLSAEIPTDIAALVSFAGDVFTVTETAATETAMLGTWTIVVTPATPAGVEITDDAMTFEF
jgi:predicted glycosyltransferase